jgi:hypothetical protein
MENIGRHKVFSIGGWNRGIIRTEIICRKGSAEKPNPS